MVMNDFDALAAGLNTNMEYIFGTTAETAGIEDETLAKLFNAGVSLVMGKFLIISCDSSFEYDHDVKVYNEAAEFVNNHFGAEVVQPFDTVYTPGCWSIRLGLGGDGEIPQLVSMNPNKAAVPDFKQEKLS